MTTGESFGRTIQLFLVGGKPTRLRKATIHGWTGLLDYHEKQQGEPAARR